MSAVFRELVLKSRGESIVRIYGLVHSSTRMSSIGSPFSTYQSLVEFKPQQLLVETSPKSLELSKFVWNTRNIERTPERFCIEEASHNESPAVATGNTEIFPIDIVSSKTRRSLAKSLVFHPWESLILISRFHGKSSPEVSSLEEVDAWRRDFQTLCPTAFKILFSTREEHMVREILNHSNNTAKMAILVGISHVNAIYDSLTLL